MPDPIYPRHDRGFFIVRPTAKCFRGQLAGAYNRGMDTKTSPTRAELETELADIRRAKRDLDGIMYLDATRKQGELVLREQEILLQLQDMPSES